MQIQENIQDRTLTLKRTIPASVESVWEAWTEPEHIAHWFGPEEIPINIEKHDFKVGGQWRYSMKMPDGNTFVSDGTYTQIEIHKKLATTADFKPMTIGVILELLFEKNAEHTEILFHVLHPTEAYKKQQEGMGFFKGWEAAFDRLETYLNQ